MRRWALLAILLIFTLGALPVFDQAKADRAVKFFEMLRHTDGQFYDQPFKLLPWQEQIIRDVYGTVREDGTRQYKYVYLEIPKKNGKSEMVAGAALYHLVADGEMMGEVYGCAADKKQALIVYKVAKKMVELSDTLKKRLKLTDSKKTITDRKTGSVYEVLSADAFTKHGFKTSACIFDELHAQPNRDLWDVMTFEAGAARRQPIWWIITTAGDDPDRVSIGWEEHDYAMRILAGEIVDPTWYVVIYHYDGEDIYNEENWFTANPSLGKAKSLESMREAAATAKNKPANERLFRWLDLNQWLTTKLTSWLPLDLWDQCVGSWNRMDLVGLDCFPGLDLSSTTDLSSLALVFPPQGSQLEWRVIWECWIPEENMLARIRGDKVPYDKWVEGGWVTPTEGNVIDYTVIEAKILELKKLYRFIELGSDRAFATMLLQRLQAQRITVVNVPQTFVSLTDPMNQIDVLLHEHKFSVENNPVARWGFGNAQMAVNGNDQKKLVKEHKGKSVVRTKRIDPIAAWVDAMARAMFYKGKPSVYETRGIITL